MTKKTVFRIIFSLLGLALGIYALISTLRLEKLNYYLAAISVAICLFSIGWLFNLRIVKIITGIFFIPVGLAGAIWTIWDFIQEIFFGKGVIGNLPLLGNGLTIFLLPNVLVFVFFCWIIILGLELVKGEKVL